MKVQPLPKHPLIQRHSCGGIDVLAATRGQKSAVLYFHGFPGPFEALPEGQTRAADHVFDNLKERVDFFYPLYTLKEAGSFSFLRSFKDAETALDFASQRHKYESVYLAAQSWGTVVAMPLIKKFTFQKIFLVTPYLSVPKGADGAALVAHYSSLHPDLLQPHRVPQLAVEFDEIAHFFTPMSLLLESAVPKVVFAAERDDVVPLGQVEMSIARMSNAKLVVLPNEGHVIEDKARLGELFRNEID